MLFGRMLLFNSRAFGGVGERNGSKQPAGTSLLAEAPAGHLGDRGGWMGPWSY